MEVGLECSALKSSNISEVIYCAQRVVLFPLAPLFDFNEKVRFIPRSSLKNKKFY